MEKMTITKHIVIRYKNCNLVYPKSVILIFALWGLFLLSLFGLYLGSGVRQRLVFVKRMGEISNIRLIAEAGVDKAMLEVDEDTNPGVDGFLDPWADNEGVFKDIRVGLGRFNVFYNYDEGGKINNIFGIVDEARKININQADIKVIKRLFEAVFDMDESGAKALAASIVDFRDADNRLSIPQGSAENRYYNGLNEPYDCKNADYDVLDEVLLVRGMSKEIFDKIKNFITIYGKSKAVNVNTASEEALYAVGIKKGLTEKIIKYCKGEDGKYGTTDDNIFNSAGSVVSMLSRYYSLSPDDVANLNNVVAGGYMRVSSEYFSITSYAKTDYSSIIGSIQCVIDREGDILFWRER